MDASRAALGALLTRIRSEHPGALRQAPRADRVQDQRLPISIHLAAWAADIAGDLHDQFGSDLDLIVGLLSFPSRELARYSHDMAEDPTPTDDVELRAERPLEVHSGHDLRAPVLLTNHTDGPLDLLHRGGDRELYGLVIDPENGRIVNGHVGWAPLTADDQTTLQPRTTISLTLRIYTDSRDPRLGYALPAGTWKSVARIALASGPILYGNALPLLIRPPGYKSD